VVFSQQLLIGVSCLGILVEHFSGGVGGLAVQETIIFLYIFAMIAPIEGQTK
jgi:hypothetical protein